MQVSKTSKTYLQAYKGVAKNKLAKILTDISYILSLRKKIDALGVDDEYVKNFYSAFDERILSLILEISFISTDSKIAQNIIAYSSFCIAKSMLD